jgi:hypothetical protein
VDHLDDIYALKDRENKRINGSRKAPSLEDLIEREWRRYRMFLDHQVPEVTLFPNWAKPCRVSFNSEGPDYAA